jgi:hypothetical protein
VFPVPGSTVQARSNIDLEREARTANREPRTLERRTPNLNTEP